MQYNALIEVICGVIDCPSAASYRMKQPTWRALLDLNFLPDQHRTVHNLQPQHYSQPWHHSTTCPSRKTRESHPTTHSRTTTSLRSTRGDSTILLQPAERECTTDQAMKSKRAQRIRHRLAAVLSLPAWTSTGKITSP